MADGLNRRSFLGSSAATAAAGLTISSSLANAAKNANSKVVVGVMGMSRGKSLATGFAKLENVDVKYVCDVDTNRAAAGAAAVGEIRERPPEAISDFRRILDDADVDALVCAAPNHWHAPATILGCTAGKHVYVEKPCSHNPREGELMIEAARKYKRAVQLGTQRRSSGAIQEGIQAIRDGAIGRVYCARAYYNNVRGSIGMGEAKGVPDYFDYELWQGPAPRTPYKEYLQGSNRSPHYNWHWRWHWGNGELGNNGVHTLDLCRWGLGVDYPIRVTSAGGRYRYDDDQQTPDTHDVTYEFEGNRSISWHGLSCNRFNKSGMVTFYGEDGAIELLNGGYVLYDGRDKELKRNAGTRGDSEHLINFVDAIRNDTPLELNAEIEKGHKSTLLCHLGNIAQRTGRTLNCSPKDGHILNDEKAMALWARDYEPGWEPKV